MTKPVTCLFLGSGASHALAGIPMQREFLCSVLTKERARWIDDDCKIKDFDMKIGNSELSSWMLNVGDIELCMSHLHNVAYTNSQSNESLSAAEKHARRAIVNLRAAVADYLRKVKLKRDINKKFYDWIKKMNGENTPLMILTTNYDLVLEKMLSENSMGWCYPNIPVSGGKNEYYPDSPTTSNNRREPIPIYKLHGSISWLEERLINGEQLRSLHPPEVDPLPVSSRLKKPGKENGPWAYLFKWKGRLYNPILVPFLFQKDDWLEHGRWGKIFKTHWEGAKKHLSENRLQKIYFLGYSLPQADYHMLSWLLNLLRNSKNPNITIVCKGENERLEKVLRPFQPRVCRCGLERFLEDHV